MKNLFMGLAVVGVVATASAFTVVTHDTDAEAPVLTYTADGLVDETGAVWKGCVSIWNGLGHKCEEPLGPGEDCEYQYLGDHGSRLGDPEGHDYENPNYECEQEEGEAPAFSLLGSGIGAGIPITLVNAVGDRMVGTWTGELMLAENGMVMYNCTNEVIPGYHGCQDAAPICVDGYSNDYHIASGTWQDDTSDFECEEQ